MTEGTSYIELERIYLCEYRIGAASITLTNPVVVAKGTHLRLGQLREGEVVYSDGALGAHQPFDEFYTDGAPNGRIYVDGAVFVDHWDDYVEVGNPWRHGKWLYFEARKADKPAPQGWELWRRSMENAELQYVTDGANPCVYDGNLYYCIWKETRFEIAISSVED